MLKFIAWRILQFPLMLAVVYLITFLLAWVAPGSPFDRAERRLPPEVLQAIQERMHATSAWREPEGGGNPKGDVSSSDIRNTERLISYLH